MDEHNPIDAPEQDPARGAEPTPDTLAGMQAAVTAANFAPKGAVARSVPGADVIRVRATRRGYGGYPRHRERARGDTFEVLRGEFSRRWMAELTPAPDAPEAAPPGATEVRERQSEAAELEAMSHAERQAWVKARGLTPGNRNKAELLAFCLEVITGPGGTGAAPHGPAEAATGDAEVI